MTQASDGAFEVDEPEELPPALAAWLAIDEYVNDTLTALEALDSDTHQVIEFVADIKRNVRTWLNFELWAALLEPGTHTPDSLFVNILEADPDVQRVARMGARGLSKTGRVEWRAFSNEDDVR